MSCHPPARVAHNSTGSRFFSHTGQLLTDIDAVNRIRERGRLHAQQEHEAKIMPMYTLHDEDGYRSHDEWLKDRKRMKKAMNDALDGKGDWPPKRAPVVYDPFSVDLIGFHELTRDKTKDDQ